MIRAVVLMLFSLSLISCGTTGTAPSSTAETSPVAAEPQRSSDEVVPTAAPDESWVWGDRGCCRMATDSAESCFENTTENWCESSTPSYADADWNKGTSCKFVQSCTN